MMVTLQPLSFEPADIPRLRALPYAFTKQGVAML